MCVCARAQHESDLSGVKVNLGPRVVIDPTFGVGLAAWRKKLPTPWDVKLGKNSTLVLQGELRGLRIESLTLTGTLVLRMCAGANVTLRKVRVANPGWSFRTFRDGTPIDEAFAIRGYARPRHARTRRRGAPRRSVHRPATPPTAQAAGRGACAQRATAPRRSTPLCARAVGRYKLERTAQREMVFDRPGDYVIEDDDAEAPADESGSCAVA